MAILDADDSYSVTFKSNCSLSGSGKVKVMLLLTIIPCCIAVGFAWLGAWLVLPFIGLEIFALAYAFYHVSSHDSDYESISINGESLIVERCTRQELSKHVLNPYWAKVVQHALPNGELRLGLVSHGKEVEVGRFLTSKQRESLALQLEKRIGAFYK